MLPNNSPVIDAIFQGWKDYQEQLIVVLRPLSSEQLAMRVAANLRSVGEIAAHISAGRASWFSWILNEGGDEIAAIAQWDRQDKPVRAVAELVLPSWFPGWGLNTQFRARGYSGTCSSTTCITGAN